MSAFLFLWIENNPSDAAAAKATLKAGGIDCEVVQVDSRADFITALATNVFDLILSNYALPDFDGIAVLEVVHNLRPEIPLIFVCGSVGEEKAITAFEAGAAGFVLKQQLERLVPCVQRALRQAEESRNRKRTELVFIEQQRLLELIANGCPLEDCLAAVCASLSRLNPRVRACFLLTDAQRLTFCHSITPDFPPSLNQKLKGLPINDLCIGTCGEAVYRGEPISCADIANDNRWSLEWREVCLAHGVLACHSQPVMSLEGLALGSLMLCFDEVRMPTQWEYQLADFGTHVASIVFERDRTNLALRDSEERARLAIQVVQLGTWRYDLNTNLVQLDKRMREIWGEPESREIIPLPQVIERIHPDDQERVTNAVGAALDPYGSGTYKIDYRIVWNDGQQRWVSANGQAQFEGEGKFRRVIDFIGTALDITDSKQTEVALRQSEQQIRLATASANLGMWYWDIQQDKLSWTEQCKALFGLPADIEMTYQIFLQALHPDDRQRTHAVVTQCIKCGLEYDIEYRTLWSDGTVRWIAAKGNCAYDATKQPTSMTGVALDITERKQAEVEREQLLQREQAARAELERANRIKNEFLAVLSHELRSPLNPILGWTHLLQTGKLDPTRQREALATIERNAKLQTQLIEDLLDISRIIQGKLSLKAAAVSLTFVITAAVETVRLAAEAKNIALVLDLGRVVAPVLGDAARLQQVVWNLLTNAIKFTPNGGQVTVELRQLDGLAQIRVIDTGKGINPSFLPHVFEYFRQADSTTTRQFGGLGLGLAIVRQIVDMHGGTVEADSLGENQGATFTIQLPVIGQTTPTISELPQAKAENLAAPLKNLQILVVDDDADTREFLAFLLQQSGAKVIAAASGLEALQVLEQFIPDLLLSDVGMAQMDGYMLLQQIRSHPPHRGGKIRAIAVTAYAMDFDRQKALGSGFQAHITKPVEPEILIKEILNLLEQN